MPMQHVVDTAHDVFRPYAETKDTQLITLRGKGHDWGFFIAESKQVIERALNAGCVLQSILVERRWANHEKSLIDRVLLGSPSVPVVLASHEEFQRITGYDTTRGALACFARPAPRDVAAVLAGARRVALLEDITNYTNLGAIFRNAAALSLDAVLLSPSCHDPLYRRAARVSMGCVFQVPWARIKISKEHEAESCGISLLRRQGFTTVALALRKDALPIDDPLLRTAERLAMVLGTEGDGLRSATIDACDYTAIIPMRAGIDSLNVAAASAVAFWELRAR